MQDVLRDNTAGDPVTGLRWTHKTPEKIAAELRRRGWSVGRTTVRRLLRQLRYSLRTNRKRLAPTHEPYRAQQFRLLARRRQWLFRHGWPVLAANHSA